VRGSSGAGARDPRRCRGRAALVPAHELDAAERGHGREAEREARGDEGVLLRDLVGVLQLVRGRRRRRCGDAPPRPAKSSASFSLPFRLRSDRTGRETATAAGRWMPTSGIRSCYGSSAVFSLTAEDANP
jgi:hypothetical protein